MTPKTILRSAFKVDCRARPPIVLIATFSTNYLSLGETVGVRVFYALQPMLRRHAGCKFDFFR